MSASPEQPQRIGTPLWLKITVAVSLAINLLIAGIVLGAIAGRDRDGSAAERMRVSRDLAPPPFIVALDAADRRAIVRKFRQASAPFGQNRAELKADLAAILDALRADEFDGAAVEATLSGLRDRGVARQEEGMQVLIGHLSTMTPAARRAYADRLEAALRRGAR